MTALSKNVYINKLDKVVDKYDNTYHRAMKMKPGNVTPATYIGYGVEHNDKESKNKVGDHVRILI